VNIEGIKARLGELGYPVLEGTEGAVQNSGRQWLNTILLLLLIIAVYLVLNHLGVFYLFPVADEQTALPVLFLTGLLTSVHCVSMCGGINISQCAGAGQTAATGTTAAASTRLLPSLAYNGGRVISYTLIGGAVGALGSAITPSGAFRGIVALAAAFFMLIMGLNMLGLFPALRNLMPRNPFPLRRLPAFFYSGIDRTGTQNRAGPGKGPFVVGLLNGLMPCGPLQAMQLYALSTGSFFLGALSMLLFSLGTTPLMFGLGALSSILSARFTRIMMRVSAALVIILGIMMLNNGLALSGLNPFYY
jgi:sulfite exporter TauE/SafE